MSEASPKKVKVLLAHLAARSSSLTGKAGEIWVRRHQGGGKCRIPSLSKTAQYRVPDALTERILIEVKNVKHQGLTHQLMDFLLYAEASERIFVLHLRDDAKISPGLRAMIDLGRIQLNPLGHLFTAKGQSAFKAALMPMIWDAMRSMYGGNSEDAKNG